MSNNFNSFQNSRLSKVGFQLTFLLLFFGSKVLKISHISKSTTHRHTVIL